MSGARLIMRDMPMRAPFWSSTIMTVIGPPDPLAPLEDEVVIGSSQRAEGG